ncbi:hypothetical protein [Catenovulum agarivorans]|uniref:hypothetical protein n=1 Tax=Catenovulum agarivorans TaxID=1172192 RepID=UPI00036732E4|nr:hypothetical protein [Catenovulum agarivorans]
MDKDIQHTLIHLGKLTKGCNVFKKLLEESSLSNEDKDALDYFLFYDNYVFKEKSSLVAQK